MKILHIINYYHEGFGYQENFLAHYQKKLGHEVIILTSDYYFPFNSYNTTMRKVLGERKKGAGVFQDNGVSIIRKKSILSNSRPGLICFSISSTVTDFSPDIVHVHGTTNIWIPQLIYYQSKLKFKIFIDSHQDFSVENYSKSVIDRLYYWLWGIFHRVLIQKRNVNKYLPITKQSGDWLYNRLKIPRSMQTISPLGVDLSTMFYCEYDDVRLRKEWKAEDKLVIVNAGKQYKEKEILWIIEIAIALHARGVNIFLVLVGMADDRYDKEINTRLTKLDNDSWVRLPFLKRKELRCVYSASDIGVWPGIPSNTIQEAMACRVALLLPNNNIVGHLIDGNGIYIATSVARTVDDLCNLVFSTESLNQMKLESQKVVSNYSWKKITIDLLNLYKSNKQEDI
jgi:glycosyltransferase involved in cell wall biosynthesis